MIFYPISTLMQANIRDIVIISSKEQIRNFEALLGDGTKFGINFVYRIQENAGGIPQAFEICADLIPNKEVWLTLGDNIFFGQGFSEHLKRPMAKDAQIFALKVKNPRDFGVVEIDSFGNPLSIVEKPKIPKSELASVGLYRYRAGLEYKIKQLTPSSRGEFEITDINNMYIKDDQLELNILGRGLYWCDAGTIERLLEAGQFIKLSQNSNNYLIGCPEEIALDYGWINPSYILEQFTKYRPKNHYQEYVYRLAKSRLSNI